jgi:hypothetical protein
MSVFQGRTTLIRAKFGQLRAVIIIARGYGVVRQTSIPEHLKKCLESADSGVRMCSETHSSIYVHLMSRNQRTRFVLQATCEPVNISTLLLFNVIAQISPKQGQ